MSGTAQRIAPITLRTFNRMFYQLDLPILTAKQGGIYPQNWQTKARSKYQEV